jgi:hypothetical protein
MSDGSLTNAAVEWLRFGMNALNSVERPPTDVGVTDDFVFQDGRSGFNFGRVEGPAAYREWLTSLWDLTDQPPRLSVREVVAVRGRRCATVVVNIDYRNGTGAEYIECWRVDTTLRRADLAIAFDLDDVDGALAELDRMHAEIEH